MMWLFLAVWFVIALLCSFCVNYLLKNFHFSCVLLLPCAELSCRFTDVALLTTSTSHLIDTSYFIFSFNLSFVCTKKRLRGHCGLQTTAKPWSLNTRSSFSVIFSTYDKTNQLSIWFSKLFILLSCNLLAFCLSNVYSQLKVVVTSSSHSDEVNQQCWRNVKYKKYFWLLFDEISSFELSFQPEGNLKVWKSWWSSV